MPARGRTLLNGIFVAGGLGPHAEVCLCMGQLDEIQGQLPMQSLYLTAQQENLLSLCCIKAGCHDNGAYLHIHELSTALGQLTRNAGQRYLCWYGYLCAYPFTWQRGSPTRIQWTEH